MKNLFSCFSGCYLENLEGLNSWNVSNCESLASCFMMNPLRDISEISKWDVKNVRDFSCMFTYCENLESVADISHWEVSQEACFYGMFEKCPIKDFEELRSWFPEMSVEEIKNKVK